MSEELDETIDQIFTIGQYDGVQINEDEQMFYGTDQSFYSGLYLETAYANGQTNETLTPISKDDYDAWFNPPAGKYGSWVDGKPVLLDIPAPDYPAINGAKAQRLKDNAMASIQVLITKLNMGRTLTTVEKAKINAVLDYCDAVDEVDLTVANPTWPDLPNT